MEHLIGTNARPNSVNQQCPPASDGTYTHTVSRLVHDGSRTLISRVGSHTHAASIATVRCRCARTIGNTEVHTLNVHQVVPDGRTVLQGVVDAVVLLCASTVVVPIGHRSLRNGDDLHFVTVCHLVSFSQHIRTSIVDGCWGQVLHHVNQSVVRKCAGRLPVKDSRVAFRAVAESRCFHLRTVQLVRESSECHRSTTCIPLVGRDGRNGSCRRLNHKQQLGIFKTINSCIQLVIQTCIAFVYRTCFFDCCTIGIRSWCTTIAQRRYGLVNGCSQCRISLYRQSCCLGHETELRRHLGDLVCAFEFFHLPCCIKVSTQHILHYIMHFQIDVLSTIVHIALQGIIQILIRATYIIQAEVITRNPVACSTLCKESDDRIILNIGEGQRVLLAGRHFLAVDIRHNPRTVLSLRWCVFLNILSSYLQLVLTHRQVLDGLHHTSVARLTAFAHPTFQVGAAGLDGEYRIALRTHSFDFPAFCAVLETRVRNPRGVVNRILLRCVRLTIDFNRLNQQFTHTADVPVCRFRVIIHNLCLVDSFFQQLCLIARPVTIQRLSLTDGACQYRAQSISSHTLIDDGHPLPVQPLRARSHRCLHIDRSLSVHHHVLCPGNCIPMSQRLSTRLHAVGLEIFRSLFPVVLRCVRHSEIYIAHQRHSRLHLVRSCHHKRRGSIRAILTVECMETEVVRADREGRTLLQRAGRVVAFELCPTERRAALIPSVCRSATHHVGIHQQERHVERRCDICIHHMEQFAGSCLQTLQSGRRSRVLIIGTLQRILILTRLTCIRQHLIDTIQLTFRFVERIGA